MEIDKEMQKAEIARLEAERHKLQLEAQEIERRINAQWWQGSRFAQYVLAIVITAALLFGWTRVYLEPILSKDKEIADKQNTLNQLQNEELSKKSDKIERENKQLSKQRDEIKSQNTELNRQRDVIEQENKRLIKQENEIRRQLTELRMQQVDLKNERDRLQEDTETLNGAIKGLNFAVELVAKAETKHFSLVNRADRINELEKFDWTVWSDNYFGELGYYLVINHEDVRTGKDIIVTRESNIDALKREFPDNWRKLMQERTDYRHKKAPVVALDYSYFGLFAEGHPPVGGTVYEHDGGETKFYAPLSAWKEKLGELLGP